MVSRRPPFDIFSYWGIVWCHIAFSTSVRFLLLTPAFTAMDAALEDAARTSGSNNLGVLLRITIPILAPAVLASTALGFIRSLESLEIEMVLGIPAGIYVVPTKIWDYIHWEPPLYDRATALCSVFLLFVFFLIWMHRILLRGKEFTTVSGRSYMVRIFPLGRWRWVTCGFCLLFIFMMIILPLAMLIMGTFMEFFGNFTTEKVWTVHHWTAVFTDPVFLGSLKNTLVLGLGAGIVGTILYATISYVIVRTQAAGPRCRRHPVLAALGLAGCSHQPRPVMGCIRIRRLCEANLRHRFSFGAGDHHQRDAAREPRSSRQACSRSAVN